MKKIQKPTTYRMRYPDAVRSLTITSIAVYGKKTVATSPDGRRAMPFGPCTTRDARS